MLSKVLHIEIQKAISAIGGEQIGGNVVKENWWRGYLAALCHIQAECAAEQGEGANLHPPTGQVPPCIHDWLVTDAYVQCNKCKVIYYANV